MKELKINTLTIEETLEHVRNGDDAFLRKMYESNRAAFIKWFIGNHQITEDEAIDLYQKSFTIFYFNVKNEKVTSLNSSVNTYLYGIGKNLVKEVFRSKRHNVQLDEVPEVEVSHDDFFRQEEMSHQQSVVKKILDKLGEPCKSILLMYYFKNFSMDSIASNLGYKNEGVVKKKKCLCLKKIREEMIQHTQ